MNVMIKRASYQQKVRKHYQQMRKMITLSEREMAIINMPKCLAQEIDKIDDHATQGTAYTALENAIRRFGEQL